MACLILNNSYRPLYVASDKHTIVMLSREVAKPTEFGPYMFDEIPDGDNVISMSTTHGFYCFNDIVVAKTNYYRYRRLPFPSARVIKERDGYICAYCGEFIGTRYSTIDHVVPQSAGGEDTYENLVCCCRPCNLKKGSKSLETFLEETGYGFAMPRKPQVEFALYFSRSKKHWDDFLFL